MKQRILCEPENVVRFLLGLCCSDDSSTTPVSDDEVLKGRFEDCLQKVIQIANSGELQKKLEDYKSSSSNLERAMYTPFAEAVNYALESLSHIKVEGLPEFKTHIAFVPCDRGVESNRRMDGSLFKPDLVVMYLPDAREFYGLDKGNGPKLGTLISEIGNKSPVRSAAWKTVLSIVEVKRKAGDLKWGKLGAFDLEGSEVGHTPDADKRLDEMLDDPELVTPVSSTTLVTLSKRSASTAGMDESGGASCNKRQRREKKTTGTSSKSSATQNGIYAAEKFSDSFCISHVVNLIIRNDTFWISWTDRQGAIFSSACSLFENLPLMLVLLLTLQRFGRRQWGYISELTTGDDTVLLHPVGTDETLGKDGVTVNFYPEDEVHSSWALLGRATTIVGANMIEKDGSGVAGEECAREPRGGAEGGKVGPPLAEDTEDIQQVHGEARTDHASTSDHHSANFDTTKINIGAVVNKEVVQKAVEEWSHLYQARDEYRKAYAKTIGTHNLVLKVSWPETSRLEEWRVIERARSFGKKEKFIRGHIPEVKYARDFDRYSTKHIRDFLGLPQDEKLGTRTLRLIVMSRLWPIYDLDGEQFWRTFWQCVACHYRLWVNGIQHGDISLKNLMYGVSAKTGDPIGILNDFDLATCSHHLTTNNDRTGTIPFMAIDLLDGGLDTRTPRLYRHDLESFSWVLAYITVAHIQYRNGTIDVSPVSRVRAWFKDADVDDRQAHVASKETFYRRYGKGRIVSGRYYEYLETIKAITKYWPDFHEVLLDKKDKSQPRGPDIESATEEQVPGGEGDENATESLKQFVSKVGKDGAAGYAEVKSLLEATKPL